LKLLEFLKVKRVVMFHIFDARKKKLQYSQELKIKIRKIWIEALLNLFWNYKRKKTRHL